MGNTFSYPLPVRGGNVDVVELVGVFLCLINTCALVLPAYSYYVLAVCAVLIESGVKHALLRKGHFRCGNSSRIISSAFPLLKAQHK